MTAAAYPVIIANSMARCLYQVDIQPVIPAPKCTIWDWNTVNFTSVVLSCGPQQIRADRCCNLILGMYGQVHALYQNQTGHGLIDVRPLFFLDLFL